MRQIQIAHPARQSRNSNCNKYIRTYSSTAWKICDSLFARSPQKSRSHLKHQRTASFWTNCLSVAQWQLLQDDSQEDVLSEAWPERLKKLKEINRRFLRVFFSSFSNLSTFLLEVWCTLKVPTDPAMSPRQVSWKLRVVWRQKLAELFMFAARHVANIHLVQSPLRCIVVCFRALKDLLPKIMLRSLLSGGYASDECRKGRTNESGMEGTKEWMSECKEERTEGKITVANRFHSVFTSVVVSSGDGLMVVFLCCFVLVMFLCGSAIGLFLLWWCGVFVFLFLVWCFCFGAAVVVFALSSCTAHVAVWRCLWFGLITLFFVWSRLRYCCVTSCRGVLWVSTSAVAQQRCRPTKVEVCGVKSCWCERFVL